jgi:hypothetical protein
MVDLSMHADARASLHSFNARFGLPWTVAGVQRHPCIGSPSLLGARICTKPACISVDESTCVHCSPTQHDWRLSYADEYSSRLARMFNMFNECLYHHKSNMH